MRGEAFDPACLLIPVAIKALWLAYKRGHWEVLRKLGLRREDIEEPFKMYDALRVARTPGLRGNKQVLALLKAYPPLIDAAVRLVGLYMISWDRELKQYLEGATDAAHTPDLS